MTEETPSRRVLRTARTRARRRRTIRDCAALVAGAVIVTVVLQACFIRGFWVPSESMEPALFIDDRILVDEVTPKFDGLRSGDVVVFRDPGGWTGPTNDGDRFLVKRVIGLPGDRVEGLADGTIEVNGTVLEEPGERRVAEPPFSTTVEAGHLWVMGDNRGNSSDSRFHGAVPVSDVVGRVVWVYWPLNHWGVP